MCYVEHVCHTPCEHWSDRITKAGACPKVRSVGSVQLPCSQKIRVGMANDDSACLMCSKRPNRNQLQPNSQFEFNDAYLDPLPSPKPVYGIVNDFPRRCETPQPWVREEDANEGAPGLESSQPRMYELPSPPASIKSATHEPGPAASTESVAYPPPSPAASIKSVHEPRSPAASTMSMISD
jgi:hypothetical protein